MPRALSIVGLLALAAALVLDRSFPPNLGRIADRSTTVVARDGELLRAYTTTDGRWRFPVEPENVSPNYLAMLIASEDQRFWSHPGVDALAADRAIWQLLRHGGIVSGASTLTMQVARLLEPRPRTLRSKLIEVARSLQLEARLDKRRILEIYLTLAPFGGNLEGVRAASLAWFGKEPAHLSDAEAALLVALPQAPGLLQPDRHPAAARAARNRILARLARRQILDPAAAAIAAAAPVPDHRRDMPLLAPQLADALRAAEPAAPALRTTIDATLQDGVQRVLAAALDKLPPPVNVAALIADHGTREMRAYAGSGAFLESRRSGMIDFVAAVRSPGSALKPFVYGAAFDELKAHPSSLLRDAPIRFKDYAPGNFDDGFDGDVTVREALRLSLNLPAVTMLERVGPRSFTERMAGAGIMLHSADDAAAPGLPIVLGGVGVTLVDLVTAYAGLAEDGVVEPLATRLEAARTPGRRLLGATAARQVTAILAGVPRPAGQLEEGHGLAFKTGTSYRFRDGWAIGYDARHVVGVWVGRADGASCTPCSGLGGAAPIMLQLFGLLPAAPLASLGLDAAAAAAPAPGGLARLDRRPALPLPGGERPTIAFPPDGARVEPAAGGLSLEVEGGTRPFRWLVDGRPLGEPAWRRAQRWRPTGPGFVTITVLDAGGRSARAAIRVDAVR
jgi:penicillin-binding protein 1C